MENKHKTENKDKKSVKYKSVKSGEKPIKTKPGSSRILLKLIYI